MNWRDGEKLFAQRMIDKGYKVLDVSKNPDYFDKDIDFIVFSPATGLTKSFEIKTDTKIHKTGNLYLELSNIHSKQWNGEGWWKHCEADYLVYIDAARRKFYIIPLLELKERVEQSPKTYAQCGCDSIGLLVKLDSIKDIVQEL